MAKRLDPDEKARRLREQAEALERKTMVARDEDLNAVRLACDRLERLAERETRLPKQHQESIASAARAASKLVRDCLAGVIEEMRKPKA